MNTIKPFRFWCQKILPLVYDESLSYYELLCKVVDYLNSVISNCNELIEGFTQLSAAYAELKNYVDNYFNNLDVQEEINNKLDALVEDGTFDDMVARSLPFVFKGITTLNMSERYSYIEDNYNNGICNASPTVLLCASYGDDGITVNSVDATTGGVINTSLITTDVGINDISYSNGKLYFACGENKLKYTDYPIIGNLTDYELPDEIESVFGVTCIDEDTICVSDSNKPQNIYIIKDNAIIDSTTISNIYSYEDNNRLNGGLCYYGGYIFAFSGRPNEIKVYDESLNLVNNITLCGCDTESLELEGITIDAGGNVWIANTLLLSDGTYANNLLVSSVIYNNYKGFPFILDINNPTGSLANYYNVSANATHQQNGSVANPYATIDQALLHIKLDQRLKIIRMHSDSEEFNLPSIYNVNGLEFFQRNEESPDVFVGGNSHMSTVYFNNCVFNADPDETDAIFKAYFSHVYFNGCTFNGNEECDGVLLERSIAHFINCTFNNCKYNVHANRASLCIGAVAYSVKCENYSFAIGGTTNARESRGDFDTTGYSLPSLLAKSAEHVFGEFSTGITNNPSQWILTVVNPFTSHVNYHVVPRAIANTAISGVYYYNGAPYQYEMVLSYSEENGTWTILSNRITNLNDGTYTGAESGSTTSDFCYISNYSAYIV